MAEDTGDEDGEAGGRRSRRKRDPGDGSLYQRSSDGRWMGRLTLPGGGRRYVTGSTRRAVKDRLRQALRALEDGGQVPDQRVTLGIYLERWLAGLASTGLRPRTVGYYHGYARNYILNTDLARKPLARLTPADLQRLYARKLAEGLSTTTVHHLHAVIHRALGTAYRHGEVPRNVAGLLDKKEKPGVAPSPMRALTGDQPEQLLAEVLGDPLEALFVVAVTAGLRQGELLGLRWRDVHVDRGVLSVTGSLQQLADGRRSIGPAKSGRGRVVELAPVAVAALKEHRRRQHEGRLVAGSMWDDRDLVFCNLLGGYLYPASLNRALNRLLKAAGLPPVRFHDLRHTAATRLLERGVHPKLASEMLGHSSVGITLDLYSHVSQTLQRDAIRKAWSGAES